MTTQTTEVQETILEQIRSLDKWALGAWGAREFKASGATLIFRVNGTKLKRGWIEVAYNEISDTYTVMGMRQYAMKIKTTEPISGVYWDSLVQVIDGIVG